MKSEKAVTLTSLIIYVTIMCVVVSIITVLTTYFNKNVINVSNSANSYKQYTKFNSYFVQDINLSNNAIIECSENYVVFSSGNQYTFQNNSIYFNKVKICTDLKQCTFAQSTDTNGNEIVTVNIVTDNDKTFSLNYVIKSW